jgi:hypothetical protein
VLISEAGKEVSCRTESNIGLEDLIEIFTEMEARETEIVINGNKCHWVCLDGNKFININSTDIIGML